MNKPDHIVVFEFNAGDGDGADIIFDINGQRVAASVFPSHLPEQSSRLNQSQQSLKDQVIDLISRAISPDDDESERIVDEVLDIILNAGKTVFSEVAPPKKPISRSSQQDLHSLLYPNTLAFRLEAVGGTAALVPIGLKDPYTCFETPTDDTVGELFTINDDLPQYSSKDIFLVEIFVQGMEYSVGRVLVNGLEMFCKARGRNLLGSKLEEELQILKATGRARLPPYASIRMPQLLGYVKHAETGRIIGLLRDWAPGRCLEDIDVSVTPAAKRQRWASQIRSTFNKLHEIGVNCASAKARKVIIDEIDEAWLIGFGDDLVGRGIKDIIEFLEVEEDDL
ncbi:hypothetical protein O1611_g10353 [Lasiodiplodia mahajangana]|uniref:Uncharacterized protein n=1 Tax=Lasiodiplodia mahajangana TaxID=1108764 RepID=A0ACC2IZ96_9PEZI|nr:hypothetical protein O1611_g10353 [Lasiodiplodia mahajangana]